MEKQDIDTMAEELCALLPYGVKIGTPYGDFDLISVDYEAGRPTLWGCQNGDMLNTGQDFDIEGDCVKPYLRPLDSLTDDELDAMRPLLSPQGTAVYDRDGIHVPLSHFGTFIPYWYADGVVRHLRSLKADVRDLIGKGLALPAPEGMYGKEDAV